MAIIGMVFFLAGTSCKRPVPQPVPQVMDLPETDRPVNSTTTGGRDPQPKDAMNPDMQGHDESLGVKTLRGKLSTTKGHQPMVEGVILSKDIFSKDRKLAEQRIHEMEGKVVEVTGEVVRHHCGPLEQCLSQGYIDGMKEVESFEVVD